MESTLSTQNMVKSAYWKPEGNAVASEVASGAPESVAVFDEMVALVFSEPYCLPPFVEVDDACCPVTL